MGFPLDCDLSDCVMALRGLQFPEHPLESYIRPEIRVERLSALHDIPPSLLIHRPFNNPITAIPQKSDIIHFFQANN